MDSVFKQLYGKEDPKTTDGIEITGDNQEDTDRKLADA